MSTAPCGLLVLHKPSGVTSFRSLNHAKQALGTRKLGHTGTLDKFASGVLPALVGPAAKFSSYFMDLAKVYRATICFGTTTTTLDPEGELCGTGRVPSALEMVTAAQSFVGKIEQLPPDYSAIHVNGRRASDIARTGEKPALRPRTVQIYKLEVESVSHAELQISVRCSRGTYIRALARDIAAQLSTVAYLSMLERQAVGEFTLQNSVAPDQIDPGRDLRPIEEFLHSLPAIAQRTVQAHQQDSVIEGRPLNTQMLRDPPQAPETSAILSSTGEFLALAEFNGEHYKYRFVRPRELWWRS